MKFTETGCKEHFMYVNVAVCAVLTVNIAN